MAPAAMFTVDDAGEAGDADTGDGVCATAGAVCTLRAAIEQANVLDGAHTINLPTGTYVQSATLPAIVKDVKIAGADGDTVIESSGAGRPRLFEVPAGGTLRLDLLWLRNAATGPGSVVHATGGDVHIVNCAVTGNEGGAVLGDATSTPATPALMEVLTTGFLNNTGGPAIEAGDSYALYVQFGTFNANAGDPSGFGGAIALTGAGAGRSHAITSTFIGNTAGGGGAISIVNGAGTVHIVESSFSGNEALRTGYGGGAILSFNPALTITSSTFSDNKASAASQNGGAILSPGTAFRCTGSTFTANVTSGTGGAICATGMTILNSTFSGNQALFGGAIYVDVPGCRTRCRSGAPRSRTIRPSRRAAGCGAEARASSSRTRSSRTTSPARGPTACRRSRRRATTSSRTRAGARSRPEPAIRWGPRASPINPGLAPLGDGAVGVERRLPRDRRGADECVHGFRGRSARDGPARRAAAGGRRRRRQCGVRRRRVRAEPRSRRDVDHDGHHDVDGRRGLDDVDDARSRLRRRRRDRSPAPRRPQGHRPAGDEAMTLTGTLVFPAGEPASFDPATTGAQVLLEDLGNGVVSVFELSHRTQPIPGGAGCGTRDGWTKSRYTNASGRIDPPRARPAPRTASARSASRTAGRRARASRSCSRRSVRGLEPLTGPFRATIVLGASAVASSVGDCGTHAFAPGGCSVRRGTLRCR
jgi:predicted outer membrane repeat protein